MRRKPAVLKSQAEVREPFEMPESEWGKKIAEGCFAARVVEVHKRYAFVSTEKEEGKIETRDVWLGTLARKHLLAKREERNFVCVGDRVLCQPSDNQKIEIKTDLPQCQILNMAPRRSRLEREDPGLAGRVHVLASNIDQLLIVSSFRNPKVRWGLIDRYLVLAESENIQPILIFNKLDLLRAEGKEAVAEAETFLQVYRDLGYKIFLLQANKASLKKPDIAELRSVLDGKISIFSGHSGVGKSSIINVFDPEIVQTVDDVQNFYKGRHTTTFASFIKLGTGGYVIDTPGIRSFSIAARSAIDLSGCFPELRPLIGKCKYRECAHDQEPQCVVKEGVAAGTITPWRYQSYLNIFRQTDPLNEDLREHDTGEVPDEL